MSANINTNPTVVTVFGDSWSTTARVKPADAAPNMQYIHCFQSAAAAGLGYVASANYLLDNRSYGGVSADNAVNGTGNFPAAISSGAGTTFAMAAGHDFAKYQVFRYGINDVVQTLWPDFNTASPNHSARVSQCAAAGLDANHNIVNSSQWATFRTNFRNKMVGLFNSLCNSSKAVGRKPLLAKMTLMTPHSSGSIHWTQRHVELMQEVSSAISSVASAQGARVIDQTDNTLTGSARWDAFHPNPDPAQRIAVDFGQKLRVALAGY